MAYFIVPWNALLTVRMSVTDFKATTWWFHQCRWSEETSSQEAQERSQCTQKV